jgi:GTPase SAR1 family protein
MQLSSILVGNKADLLSSNVDLQVLMEKEKRGDKKSISDQARYYDQQKGIKFFEISTKCSTKQEIEALFVELVHQNEVLNFVKFEKSEGGSWWSKYVPPMPCNE